MPFTVLYDANALYPMSLRDLLVRVGQTTLVRARWTAEIMDEWSRALVAKRPDLETRVQRTVQLMNEAIRDVLVTGYESLIPGLQLPDPGDRHVLAAAIRAGAQTIVTFNLGHFPQEALAPYGIEAQHPDELIEHLIDLGGGTLADIVVTMAADKRKPPMTPQEVIESLRRAGLPRSADVLPEVLRWRERRPGYLRPVSSSLRISSPLTVYRVEQN
jgi:PIN domain-containing protein